MQGISEMNIRRVIDAIEDFAPRALQESYDNAGLQAGDATNSCTGVLLTLDVSESTIKEAAEHGFNCVVSHHPLLFKGAKSITPTSEVGRILIDAIRAGITIYSAHTNLDNARFGVSYRMAQKFGLLNVRKLQPQVETHTKLVTFVPISHLQEVKDALAQAGAGEIGEYDSCSYTMAGTGTFRAKANAHPFAGECGELHEEPEMRIEVILPKYKLSTALKSMLQAHPYEEPAFDVIPLLNEDKYAGSGAIGELERPVSLDEFVERAKSVFDCGGVRYSDCGKTVKTVALCGGSGASFINDAIAYDCDVYVTGDLKYHDFTTFASQISLIDVGHYESEQCSKEIIYDILTSKFPQLLVRMAQSDINTIKYK